MELDCSVAFRLISVGTIPFPDTGAALSCHRLLELGSLLYISMACELSARVDVTSISCLYVAYSTTRVKSPG